MHTSWQRLYYTAQMSLAQLLEPVYVLHIRVTDATLVTALAWSAKRCHCFPLHVHLVKHNLYLHMP